MKRSRATYLGATEKKKKKEKKPTFHSPSSWNTRFNSKRDDNGATITPTRVEERNYPSMSPTRERN